MKLMSIKKRYYGWQLWRWHFYDNDHDYESDVKMISHTNFSINSQFEGLVQIENVTLAAITGTNMLVPYL